MSPLDKLNSLDEKIKEIREHYENEIRFSQHEADTARVELELTKAALKKSEERALASERLAIRLVTQFSTVESVFNEARLLAQQVEAIAERNHETTSDPSPYAPKPETQAIARLAEEVTAK